jgi:hypothetical protein
MDVVEQRLAALFMAGCLLLNIPLLSLWQRDVAPLGIPLFPMAIFLVWALLIAALALIVERFGDGGEHAGSGHDPVPLEENHPVGSS